MQLVGQKLFLGMAILHTLLGLWILWRLRRWTLSPASSWRRAGVRLPAEAVALAVVATLLATAVNGLLRGGRFLFEQLTCQALFVEGTISLLAAGTLLTRRRSLMAAVPLIALGFLGWAYWEAFHHGPTDLRVRAHSLARSLSGARHLRVVHLSDMQPAQVGLHERRAFRAAIALRPDVVCITGDFVDGHPAERVATITADLFAAMREERLTAPLGVFVVLGDTDGSNPGLRAALAESGATVLSDEVTQRPLPGSRLWLVGLSNGWSRGANPAGLQRLVASAPETDVRIVLGHRPDYVRHLVGSSRVDLCLAGHTHGGQVALPLLGPLVTLTSLPRRFAAGLNDYEGVPLHVSRGIGMERGIAPHVRFLCPPEVCLIELRF
jgi:uncharacterized protein